MVLMDPTATHESSRVSGPALIASMGEWYQAEREKFREGRLAADFRRFVTGAAPG